MNLIEALRTGKSLRRPIAKHLGTSKDGWLGNEFIMDILSTSQYSPAGYLRLTHNWIDRHDLLADDWEVKE